jgi:hypothetical protein
VQFLQISVGPQHSCALDQTFVAYCWGNNGSGRLGIGSSSSSVARPVAIAGPRFQAVSAGSDFSCGLSMTNSVWCWGNASSGRLGIGNLQFVRYPMPLPAP